MLRAVFVILLMLVGALQSLQGPFNGLLFYLWMAYFRPESWVWFNFITDLNLSLIIGVFVTLATLLSGQKLRFGSGPLLLCAFFLQTMTSTLLSPVFNYALLYWTDFAKSTIITFLIVTLVSDAKRLRLTVLVIAISLGFETAKQGWAQIILNPGGQNFNNIPLFGDNNGVAVAMLMLTPMLLALAQTATWKVERVGHRLLAVGVLYRGIVTYSRGGFLSCIVLGLHYVLRARQKLLAIVAVAVLSLIIIPLLPQEFWDRMDTIPTNSAQAETAEDGSIRGRLRTTIRAVARRGESAPRG